MEMSNEYMKLQGEIALADQLADLDDRILKYPEDDPRSKQAFEEKFMALKRQAAYLANDKSIETLSMRDIKFGVSVAGSGNGGPLLRD